MNPDIPAILGLTTQRIAMGLGEQGAAFAQGTVALLATVLSMSAKEYDRAAEIRVAENNDLRALFGELAGTPRDEGLRAKLAAAAKSKDASLLISVLNQNNYALRRLLTEAMIYAELHGLQAEQKRIWAVLKVLADRRLVTLGP